MSTTDNFIDSIFEFANAKFGADDIVQVKKCIIDYLAVTNAGAKLLSGKTEKLLHQNNTNEKEFNLIGLESKTSLYNALLINSLNAHVAELDDGVRYASLHPGASVITAMLTLAKKLNFSADDIIRGILTGYEASIRMAAVIQPSHRNMGYHATGTCGAFGVALGLCAGANLDKEAYKTALSAAASGSSGMLNTIKDESELKPYNNSLAVLAGFNAFNLAKAGFKGPNDVLNGKWGYLKMKSREVNIAKLYRNLNEKPLIHDVYRKYYAACRHCHPAIEAALHCKQNHNITVGEIDSIEVQTYLLAVDGHNDKIVKNQSAAKMSTPYSVAVALIKNNAGIHEFEEKIVQDTAIQELMKKVEVVHNENMTRMLPAKRPAKVIIKTNDGQVFEHLIELAKGEPEIPFTEEDLKQKYYDLLSFNKISKETAETILDSIYNLELKTATFAESI